MLRIATCSLFALTLLSALATDAQAAMQYWVSVGSYKTNDNAQRASRDARNKMGDTFSVIRVDTPKGLYFRVATGPFADRSQADERIRSAIASGYQGAWMWGDQEEVFASGLQSDLSSATDLSDAQLDIDIDDINLDDILSDDSYLEDLPEVRRENSSEGIVELEDVPELVEEAPSNYKLNKLRRDASVHPSLQPDSIDAWREPTKPRLGPRSMPLSIAALAATVPLPEQAEEPQEPFIPPLIPISPSNPIALPRFDESDSKIRIDGVLDEAQWRDIPGVDSFLVVDPDTEAEPQYQTIVRMFYTERGLYASFQMEQPTDTLVKWFSGRDQGRLKRDNVGVTLDTSGEGPYDYWFNLALGGNQIDGTVLPERQFSGDWDGAWYGQTSETDQGWNAEIFIPWGQVAMPKEAGARTINAYVSRQVAHLDERWALPSLPFTQPLFMSRLQPLTVSEVDPKQQWSFFPFASVTQDEVDDETIMQAGADFFWRPSTNFQATATLNPDFGNVESDDVIVNLSAFETFFPEKRLFFKEGTEVFDTTPRAAGRSHDPVLVVNTRRIGGRSRAPDVPDDVTVPDRELGAPIELDAALKVIGQMGDVRYGILGATEDDAKFDVGPINYYQDGTDYGIARFLYENKAGDGSYRAIGSISTLATHPDEDASVHGVDYHYLTAGGALKLDGQFLTSDIDSVGQGYGGFVDLRYNPRQGLNIGFGVAHFDDKLDINDLGFQRRNDMTNYRGWLDYTRSDISWLRKAESENWVEYETNGDGRRTRAGIGTELEIDLKNRDNWKLGVAYYPSRFEDRDSRGNGTFKIDSRSEISLRYRTDQAERLSYVVEIRREGEDVGGGQREGEVGFIWRPIDQINIGASAGYRQRDGWLLWQGDRDFATFETTELRPRIDLDYFLTAKQQLRLSAQWVAIKADERDNFLVPLRADDLIEVTPDNINDDFVISRVNLQLRYRWELAPLSELFVVYTLNGESDDRDLGFRDLFSEAYDEPQGEQLVVKLRYRMGS